MTSKERDYFVDIECQHCGSLHIMYVNKEDLQDFFSLRKLCIEAMPYLDAGERELLLSGTCGNCFDKMFGIQEYNNET